MRTSVAAALAYGVTALAACSSPAPRADVQLEDLPLFLDSLQTEFDVPGVAFAAFDDSGILTEHVSGTKRQPDGEPLDERTVFEAASISKPLFAYLILSLVQDGVMELDASLGELVSPIPDIDYDPRAARLTPDLLLTHRGGLPNWRTRLNLSAQDRAELFGPGDTLRFVSDPGEAFLYSGEGYVLLQSVVESVTGQSLSDLAQERIFEPLDMDRSSFRFDARSRSNYSFGHATDGRADKWGLTVALASSTLHTTAADLAKFGSHLAREIRRGGTYRRLAEPAVAVDADRDPAHQWGLGLGVVESGSHTYVYHGGNNVIFIADFIYGVEENLGYVLLTNSSNGAALIEPLEQRVYGRALGR